MNRELQAKIVILKPENDEILFFNGVKGKLVRTTKNFKHAKTFNELSDRDKKYLDSRNTLPYEVVDATFRIEFLLKERGKQCTQT